MQTATETKTETKQTGTEIFNMTAELQTKEPDTAKEETVTAEKKEESSPIYLGGKKFNTVDELAKYTSELEAQKTTSVAPTYTQSNTAPTDKPISNPQKKPPRYRAADLP